MRSRINTTQVRIGIVGPLAALSVYLVFLFSLTAPAQATPVAKWQIAAVSGPTNLPPEQSEIQRVTVDAEGGTFTLSFETQQTGPITLGASPSVIESALDALPTIGGAGGSVSVVGGGSQPYAVTFGGLLADADVPPLEVGSSGLTGESAFATVTTAVPGGPGTGVLAIYALNVGAAATSGTSTVTLVLPSGITTSGTPTGSGWTCTPLGSGHSAVSCTTATADPSGLALPPIKAGVEVGGTGSSGVAHIEVTGGNAGATAYDLPVKVSATPAQAGVDYFEAGAYDEEGNRDARAGAHPYLASTAFFVTTVRSPLGVIVPAGEPKDIEVQLPPGFLGNPLAVPRCPLSVVTAFPVICPNSFVGEAQPFLGNLGGAPTTDGVVNADAPTGSPAGFRFQDANELINVIGSLRSDGDYGVTVASPSTPQVLKVYGALFTFWGAPGKAAPDVLGSGVNKAVDPTTAFLTNPSDCGVQSAEAAVGSGPLTTLQVNAWQSPSLLSRSAITLPAVSACSGLSFQPGFTFVPRAARAATPAAYDAELTFPQRGLLEFGVRAEPQLKKAVVTLPKGVNVNPASANGMQACSEAQIGLVTTEGAAPNPIRFDKSEPSCPDASKLGTVEAKSPLLEEALEGTIYLAAQEENPFHSLLALYLVIDSPRNGILVKLPGEVKPDPQTGQLTATFDNNPQLPVEHLELNFRGGGPRSPLATPAVCGTYTTRGELTPWSAPESGPPAQTEDSFQISGGPGGGGCATSEAGLPFSPSFEAGTTSTAAGAYAPLVVKLARKDGEQELTHLDFTLPPGLTGRLAGIPYCSDAAIAAAAGKTGRAEQASPSCPAASELGTVDTAAGVGSEPIHVGGHVYLAGPYKGAPLSAVVITPAFAGPFDLGTVVVRAALQVNPETAQITARSDDVPHILRGIPLQLRSVEIKVTRQGFTLNPTNCNPMTVTSSTGGLNGGSASPSSRFQVGGCHALPFKPRLKLSVLGKTNRNAKPRLKAVLTAKPGEANISRAQVNLPHSEFLEQNHIKTVCTRVQFAEGNGNGSACPKGSIYGKAKAWTPLLDKPLEGFVYLRSNGGERKLPDLVAALDGQINIALWGKVDSGKNKGIRNTFEVVPDAPVTRFVLEMRGGKKGLLVNSENLCSKQAKTRAIVRLVGQNGKVRHWKPKVANQCKTHKRHKNHRGAKGKAHQRDSRR